MSHILRNKVQIANIVAITRNGHNHEKMNLNAQYSHIAKYKDIVKNIVKVQDTKLDDVRWSHIVKYKVKLQYTVDMTLNAVK